MSDTVFVGPSLTAAEVGEALPGAAVLPPIRHGDLLRLRPRPGDRVLIVDGLFLQSPPVRHREILESLERGVVVAGASSMGALRAAELWPFGMRGVGRVFELFRSGQVTDDDEVAVAYGPADDGYPLLCQPLVELRLRLRDAVAAGVLGAPDADAVLARAKALPFRTRTARALARATTDFPPAAVFLDWHRANPHDVKRADALALLRRAADRDLQPPGPGDVAIENVDTCHLRRWRGRHRGTLVSGTFASDSDSVAVIMAFHPEFPALHKRRILVELCGSADDDSAVAPARARGLTRDTDWLDPDERALPDGAAFARVLVRAFGAGACDVLGLDALPTELVTPEVLAPARRFVAAAHRANERLPRSGGPGSPRLSFRPEAIDALLCRLWKCGTRELTARARDRGFLDLVRLRAVLEPFVALLQIHGAPRFAARQPTGELLSSTVGHFYR